MCLCLAIMTVTASSNLHKKILNLDVARVVDFSHHIRLNELCHVYISMRVEMEKESKDVTLPFGKTVFFFRNSALGMVPSL